MTLGWWLQEGITKLKRILEGETEVRRLFHFRVNLRTLNWRTNSASPVLLLQAFTAEHYMMLCKLSCIDIINRISLLFIRQPLQTPSFLMQTQQSITCVHKSHHMITQNRYITGIFCLMKTSSLRFLCYFCFSCWASPLASSGAGIKRLLKSTSVKR